MFARRKDEPIITSLMDTDFYKFTMGQLVWEKHRYVPVRYAFKNRTSKVNLPSIIDPRELRAELDHVRTLRFGNADLHYLRGTNEYGERMFSEDYLQFLRALWLPNYELEWTKDTLRLEFAGPWAWSIYWETLALSVVNELYCRSKMRELTRLEQNGVYACGTINLLNKVRVLRGMPEIVFCDFGTRRRFSREWQDYVVMVLAKEMDSKQFLGTSNTYLASKYNLLPMGTSAHEMDMVYSGIYHGSDDDLRFSHRRMLYDWWMRYGHGLSIALTDTYGTDFFFREMTAEQAALWKGLRQDSGDPIAFGEKAIAFYQKHGIDPREKLLIFSDGLEVPVMMRIAKTFSGRVKTSFGWGTNLTNDLGYNPLSLVVKVTEANGHSTVKLSDNIAKAMGAPEDIERFKRIFGCETKTSQECKY